jgi:hypothetical protein
MVKKNFFQIGRYGVQQIWILRWFQNGAFIFVSSSGQKLEPKNPYY